MEATLNKENPLFSQRKMEFCYFLPIFSQKFPTFTSDLLDFYRKEP